MPVEQFATLVSILPEMEQTLKENGEILPRPIYSTEESQSDKGKEESVHSDNRGLSKQNIEATSDEESEA